MLPHLLYPTTRNQYTLFKENNTHSVCFMLLVYNIMLVPMFVCSCFHLPLTAFLFRFDSSRCLSQRSNRDVYDDEAMTLTYCHPRNTQGASSIATAFQFNASSSSSWYFCLCCCCVCWGPNVQETILERKISQNPAFQL